MNIGKISSAFLSSINTDKATQRISFGTIQDSFELSEDGKLQKALREALEFCQKSVMGEEPIESQMAFDKTGNVLYTNFGSESKVGVLSEKLTEGSTAVHSHPDACTFSIEDIMILVTKPNLKKIASIDPQGRFCIMEKAESFVAPSQKEAGRLYNSFYATLKNHWTNALGVPQNPKQICLAENERRLMEAYGYNSVEELYQNLGFEKSGIFEEDMDKLGWRFYLPEVRTKGYDSPFGKNDPEWGAVTLEIEKIKATLEGIKIGNELMQKIANTLNFGFSSGQI